MVVPAIFRIKQSKEALKMKALRFFEMSASTFQSKRSYIPEKKLIFKNVAMENSKRTKLSITKNNTNFLTR